MPFTSVIIPAFGRPHLLRAALELVDLQAGEFEIIVVSDGCEAVKAAVQAMEFAHRCRLYDTGYTQGFGAVLARNLGARFAEGELLIFLDSDCLVGPSHVAAYLAAYDGRSLCWGPIDHVDPRDWSQVIHPERRVFAREMPSFHGENKRLARLGADCWTGNLAVPRRTFCRLGGFDRHFLGSGGEDIDFGLRYAFRYQQVKAVNAPVRHVGLSSGLLPETGHAGTGDMRLLQQLMTSGHYRPASPHLIVNGGARYFADDAEWQSSRDLLPTAETSIRS